MDDRSENLDPVVKRFTSINLSTSKKLKKINLASGAWPGEERFAESWSRIAVPKPIRLADIADLSDGSIEQARKALKVHLQRLLSALLIGAKGR